MLPHILRASHQRSYNWLSLNDNIIEIAVPKNVGIVSGISGIASEKVVFIKYTARPISSTYINSYFTLLKMYLNGIGLFNSIAHYV